jgi:hypothetical protein
MHSVLYTSYSVLVTNLILVCFVMCENANIPKNMVLRDIINIISF